jgi:hypothetical protein
VINQSDILKAGILIVDDQEANVALLEQMLHGAGYVSVSSTKDPHAVCALHRKYRYDLIVLDLQMPGIDGFQVMEALREIEPAGYLPVLVITAQPGHKLRALNSGAKDFISKPFDLPEVLVRVRNMIEVRLMHQHGTVINLRRLENAQRIANLGDWEYDFSKNHRLRWSDEVYRILGISRQEFPPNSETFYKRVHPDDLEFVHGEKRSAAKGLRRVDFEHRIVRPDGEIRFVRQVAEVTFDDIGQPALESGTVQDVTDRRISEAALLESDERYRKMLMLSPDAHYVHVDGIITFVNKAFCQMMGAPDPSQLIGRPALEIPHIDFHEQVWERQQIRAGDQSAPSFELKFVRLDGTLVDVEATTVAFDFRGHKEVQVIARDIGARKKSVTALRESEERFKFVARAVSDVVWDLNLTANSLWWNDGFLTTFGYGAGEIDPSFESWMGRIHADDRDRVNRSIKEAVGSTAESWGAEYRFQRKDGSFASVSDRGFILRDAAKVAIRMVGGMRDLTEQKKMEARYMRAQRMESIGTLAGGIAHDLNNVLAPILMAIELLKQDTGMDAKRTKILDTIHVSCQRGADLVRQVLSFARGDEHQRVAVKLGKLIEELQAIITQTFPRNIRIVAEVPQDLWPISGDPSQLHQVLLNLVVNARDAMSHGGTLSLKASNIKVDAQYAAMSHDARAGTYVLFEVSDTGCGIPPDVREKIFQPFFTTKEIGKGTGLGLATVQSLVKGHGGFVSVESDIDKGSTFRIYLPADPAIRKADSNRPFDIYVKRGEGELVLVVDDEASIREITQQTLESFGYRVIAAGDGAAAVALYAKCAKDVALVITDMMMPIMDGAATIHVLKCINPLVKVIASSGLELAESIAKANGAGVIDFLRKPFTAHALVRRVREVIDRPYTPEARRSAIPAVGRFDQGPIAILRGESVRSE